jgi:predicted esterase
VPVLVMHGEDDQIVPYVDCPAAQAVAAALLASAMGNIAMATGPRPRLQSNANSAHC